VSAVEVDDTVEQLRRHLAEIRACAALIAAESMRRVLEASTREAKAMSILREMTERAGHCRLSTSEGGVVRCRAHNTTLRGDAVCVWAEAVELCRERS
jgi:hypothetical protein